MCDVSDCKFPITVHMTVPHMEGTDELDLCEDHESYYRKIAGSHVSFTKVGA